MMQPTLIHKADKSVSVFLKRFAVDNNAISISVSTYYLAW